MVNKLSLITDDSNFDNHRLVTFLHDEESGVYGYMSIHRGGLVKPAFGATRFWKYKNNKEALKDVLRLSRIMTYKSALSNSGFGGAKSVLCIPVKKYDRNKLFSKYAEMVNYFSGHFRTGADVGISDEDVKLMRKKSPYFVGVKYDPVRYTLDGLLISIYACIKEVYGSDDISQRSFAIQGMGKTGIGLLKNLYQKSKKIYISDINENKIRTIQNSYPGVICVPPNAILYQPADVLSPCALGNILNRRSWVKIKSQIICGSANCQLENPLIGEKLWNAGILYAPDYVVNAGGLISVVDEYKYPLIKKSRVEKKVKHIGKTLTKIIQLAKSKNSATNLVADRMAVDISRNF